MSDPNIVSHLVHTIACRATKQIGRMGSRSGLHWARGDQDKCDCGCLVLLQQIRSAFELAEQYHFNNNAFDESEEWERRAFRARELLGES